MHDSHVHFTTQPLLDYTAQALENFYQKKGTHLLSCAYDIESSLQVIEIFSKYSHKYPNLIQNAIGIHPEEYHPDNNINYEKAVDNIKQLTNILNNNKEIIHAIGETGLEYYNLLNRQDIDFQKRDEAIETQKYSFREHIQIALENNLPMTIHTRDEKDSDYCTKDIVNIIASEGKTNLRAAMHSYTGTKQYLDQILELGLYIGYNAILTYKSGTNVREILKQTPLEKILIETDAPFLPPQSVRQNKKNTIKFGQPADVTEIAQAIAEIKGVNLKEVWEVTNQNYANLFLN